MHSELCHKISKIQLKPHSQLPIHERNIKKVFLENSPDFIYIDNYNENIKSYRNISIRNKLIQQKSDKWYYTTIIPIKSFHLLLQFITIKISKIVFQIYVHYFRFLDICSLFQSTHLFTNDKQYAYSIMYPRSERCQ